MAPSFSGVWNISTQYQYRTGWPVDIGLLPRSLIAGGSTNSAYSNQVQSIQISNTADAIDFGDLTVARRLVAGGGSSTRFITAGGEGSGGASDRKDIIDYKEYSSSGNLSDFGDLLSTTSVYINSIGNSNVRLIFSGGDAGGYHNVMQYITIASTGNATDFGDLSVASSAGQTGIVGTATRGISAIGINSSYTVLNTIEYVTIASTGNSTDFGDRTNAVISASGCASSTRGVFMGGNTDGTADDNVNVIDYITMVSKGNATDFGDLSQSTFRAGGISNATKGLYIGGSTDSGATVTNTIDQITIASTGNATDFADLNAATSGHSSASAEFPALETQPSLPSAIALFVDDVDTHISSIDITTLGNAIAFGDISYTAINGAYGGASSATRNCFGGGSSQDSIDLTIFATRGKGTDFGNLTQARTSVGGSGNGRGMYFGGQVGNDYVDVVDYMTISSAGNATDFGNLSEDTNGCAVSGNTTRILALGGRTSGYRNVIEYFTISSTGNATDFGDMSQGVGWAMATSSSTRVTAAGGYATSAYTNVIEYVTTASTGNATDFGDLTVARGQGGCVSNSTRGVYMGGYGAADDGTIDYWTIASTGNAIDFGDLLAATTGGAQSNGHGGIA